MNLGPYHRPAQAQQGLPLSNHLQQYGELAGSGLGSVSGASSITQAQAAQLRHPSSFDGLPRALPQSEQQQSHQQNQRQQFMASNSSSASATNQTLVPTYNLMNPMPMSMPQPNMWDDQLQLNSFEDQNGNGYYGYSPFAAADNERVDLGVPRFIPSDIHNNSFNENNNMLDVYEPSSYIAETSKPSYLQGPLSLDRSHIIYSGLDSSRDFARLSISRSPLLKHEHCEDNMFVDPLQFERAPAFRLPSSETSEDGGFSSREMTAIDDGEQAVEEPYAKLIHRALMSAPNHSMVLQEIYQWFRENTIKGSVKDGNKGWMNSIRHNLSMNAAFKKTDRKMQGDETKKSTEWVLEEFAVRDGVQSTTRYRKGTNAKKFTRNDHPAAARQSSGRKGGNATSASKNRFQRRRSKEDQLRDSRRAAAHSHSHIDSTRRNEFEQMTRSHIASTTASRQRSPLTPPDADRHSHIPYFYGKMSTAAQDMLVGESPGVYDPDNSFGMGEVQGVYLDSPLFGGAASLDQQQQHFLHGPTLASQRFV